ncbi:hypothetical protein OUZ56_011716 [Daphnia magna]|uniref:Uncharacterized protein n=1 Tax=Daphnia magna TaxID=35525 RepID=A0ABQ9Z0Y5_9CRUS|nr:hypothetical protein OUZ56_011716 [Daphnia magna]
MGIGKTLNLQVAEADFNIHRHSPEENLVAERGIWVFGSEFHPDLLDFVADSSTPWRQTNMAGRASVETLPTCPTCGHSPVKKKKKKRSQGNKDRKNKYNREKRALKRRNEKEAKKQQEDGSIPEEWQPRVVRVLETPVVPSTDCNGSSSSAVVTTSEEWEPRIVRVLEEPSVSLPDLNGDSVSGFKRGRIRQHQTIQPWGTKEWKSPEEIEAWKATQSAVAGISSELEQVAVEEGPHSEAEDST